MAETATSTRRAVGARSRTSTSRALRGARDVRVRGWLFVLPALAAYGLFVLWPIVKTFRYSLYSWDGVAPARWVGLDNYRAVVTDHELLGALEHAFKLII